MTTTAEQSRQHTSYDRATFVLGVVSILSVVFALRLGDFRFVVISGLGIAIALVLGVLACVAGWFAQPILAVAAGAVFVVAAVLQVILAASEDDWLGGNLSTTSLWLGLGLGLFVTALPRLRT